MIFLHSRSWRVQALCLLCLLWASLLVPISGWARPGKIDPHPVFGGPAAVAQLVELQKLDPSIKLDVRYASDNNFMGRVLYPQARVFLVRPAALALVRAQKAFVDKGVGLVLFDGYRPWEITRQMWEQTPEEKKQYVADPSKGSRHNRGCAVDCSLVDLKTGQPLEMPSEYDDFTERAHPGWSGATVTAQKNAARLRAGLEAVGFRIYPYEWWHFDFQGYEKYPVLNVPFQQLQSH